MPYIFHCNAQFATGWQRRTVTSKNSLSSFAFKTSRASLFLSQDEFVSIPSVASFRRMHFRRIDFYEWFSIYLRRSSTRRCTAQGSVLNRRSPPTSALGERRPMFVAHPPRLCHLHFASSRFRPNSFDVRRVKLLLQTLPDVYYGCLNGKFFCVPYSLISTIAIIRGEACDADINNIACQLSTESPLWKSILYILPKMIDRRRAFRSCAAGDWFYPGGEKNRCSFSVGVACRENNFNNSLDRMIFKLEKMILREFNFVIFVL